ncbi:hypothetical protein BDV29DRAFT_195094 [Aspergillus leporis]|uniref:Major facilitator superfamily domain-containing protein n=1 Tax=Aspergillus leporis TaxID=41062 RepID=A0A5N5WKV4_9EURO|nr:hypothetical protein BDV29DRAFT_195094 [Aspergillus leporis]
MAQENTPLLSPKGCRHQAQWILFLVCTVIVATQIFEDIICRDLHPYAVAPSSTCKNADVQRELALINRRKKVAILSMLALAICSPSMALSDILSVAGEPKCATSMAFTIMTNVYPVEKQANKFFILAAAALLAEILASPIRAWLMTNSPWLPYLLSPVCEFVGMVAALAIPETLPKVLDVDQDFPSQSAADGDGNGHAGSFREFFRPAGTRMLRLRDFIGGNKNVLAISVAFFAVNVGQQALRLMVQYVSKRFAWSMAKASILTSLKGTISLILPLLGLPIMALAPHPVLFSIGVLILALGWGFYLALCSVASALVSEAQIGLLNTTIALVQGGGGAFNYGMSLGGRINRVIGVELDL